MAHDFYSQDSLHVAVYDQFAREASSAHVDGDVDFFIECARETGGPVLELCSGTGRVAWRIADAGFEVVGLDRSPAMLARAEAKRVDHPDAVAAFVHGDMTDFELGRQFRLIYIPFRSFQALLTPEDPRSALACVRRHLADDGRFVLDLFDPRLELLVPGARMENSGTWRHPERGTTVTHESVEREIDQVSQTFREVWEFTERDAEGNVLLVEHEILNMRWGYRYEMRHLFELCGFEVDAEYSDVDRSPPAYGLEQVWVLKKARD